MKKTASEIETHLYQLLKNSAVASAISGDVYLDGLRPTGSQKEDVVISFLTGAFADFRQIGKININLYVPDKISHGVGRKNTLRCRELERICQQFCDDLPANSYRFELGRMIQTFSDPPIKQHFINVQLNFLVNVLG